MGGAGSGRIWNVWTPEAVTLMVQLANEGLSATQIAAVLPNKPSKNAVIGKLHRIDVKLAGKKHVKSIKPDRPRQPMVLRQMLVQRYEEQDSSPPDGCVQFAELKPHHCRWPFGKKDYVFCGKQKYKGYSYCLDHLCLSIGE